MLPADIPGTDHLLELIDRRDPASVTITIPSSPQSSDHERVRIAMRNAIDEAERQLEEKDLPHGTVRNVVDRLRALNDDDDFWRQQSRSLVVLSSPEVLEAYRLAVEAESRVAVGDRFDTGSLLRAVAFPQRAFVVELTRHGARLIEFGADFRPEERRLDLPDDHELMLQHTTTGGQFDRQRADGASGDRPEKKRYAGVVQDQVARIVPDAVPLILSASTDLASAYREVNTHPLLLASGIEENPQSVDDRELAEKVRTILENRHEDELDAWRERFGTLRAQGLATSRFDEVALAAVEAAIDTLHFDSEWTAEGSIDEFGRVSRADEPGPDSYALVDEIAARVLRSGGSVRAVRNSDLIDGSPVAATLRFPIGSGDRSA